MRKWIISASMLLILLVGGLLVAIWQAPRTSDIQSAGLSDHERCVLAETGDCLVFPAVSGTNLDAEEVRFPEAFTAQYTLLVVPFDRDQQVLAATWLPLFRELSAAYEDISYYSIAALPDLAAGIRLLVLGGMSAGIREAEVRQRAVILFLEEQSAFLNLLDVPDTLSIQLFITDRSGTILWRSSGEYSEARAAELRSAAAALSAK